MWHFLGFPVWYGFRSFRSTVDLLTVVFVDLLELLTGLELLEATTRYIQSFWQGLACWSSSQTKSYGISGQIFGLISSFVSNRQLRVVLATRLWNSLRIECFPLTYDLNGFKSRNDIHLLTVRLFLSRLHVSFNIFVLPFLVTSCLVVAVQPCIEWIVTRYIRFFNIFALIISMLSCSFHLKKHINL